MENNYRFKLNLDKEKSILSIITRDYYKKGTPYPVNFERLNVPVIVRKNNDNAFDLEYELDFENSFSKRNDDFYNVYCKKKNLKGLLSNFISLVDEDLRSALSGKTELNGKIYSLKLDNGIRTGSFKEEGSSKWHEGKSAMQRVRPKGNPKKVPFKI